MKVKDIIKGLNLKKGELFLIEGDIDILANKNLYERIKNKEVLYIDIDLVNDCKTYISIIENYDKMYNMSYVLIYKNKEGIVAVGDKAMSIVASLFPRRYKTLSLDATKVFKNDYFVVGFVGTAFVDIDKKSISIENVIKRLLKETKTIKEFVDKFDYICNNMEQCEYKKTATYGFFLVDKENTLSVNFKYLERNCKKINQDFLYNTPYMKKEPEPQIEKTDSLEEVAEKFKTAIARTHENQRKLLDNTFSVSKESDVVILKF